jgi:hypothetical protein
MNCHLESFASLEDELREGPTAGFEPKQRQAKKTARQVASRIDLTAVQ